VHDALHPTRTEVPFLKHSSPLLHALDSTSLFPTKESLSSQLCPTAQRLC